MQLSINCTQYLTVLPACPSSFFQKTKQYPLVKADHAKSFNFPAPKKKEKKNSKTYFPCPVPTHSLIPLYAILYE